MIIDNHGRKIDYVRLAVTDRCNLRCFYCMPEEGIDYVDRHNLLSYEEMLDLSKTLANMGISKVRITGGEPFVRKGLMDFLDQLTQIPGIDQVHLTTNGTLTKEYIPELKRMGISGINLSLDSLDRWRFENITRRDKLPEVIETLHALLDSEIPTKINMVVMKGRNTEDIIPMAELGKDHNLGIRFIEEMPFNGTDRVPDLEWNYRKIVETLQDHYPGMHEIPAGPNSTSKLYKIDGYKGELGVIAAFSRTFCGSCNRIRITPKGDLRTCLYGAPALQIRDVMRRNSDPSFWEASIRNALGKRAKDGFEAEKMRNQEQKDSGLHQSMSTIGG